MKSWDVLGRNYVVDNPWLRVRVDKVRTARGVVIDEFHVVEAKSWVGICCLTKAGEFVLVEQYRHGIKAVTLELPAGAIDHDEDPLTAARRELAEETGYTAERWVALGAFPPEPVRHTHTAYLFAALDAEQTVAAHPEETEDITVRLATPAQVSAFIDAGELSHAVHVAAIFLGERQRLYALPKAP